MAGEHSDERPSGVSAPHATTAERYHRRQGSSLGPCWPPPRATPGCCSPRASLEAKETWSSSAPSCCTAPSRPSLRFRGQAFHAGGDFPGADDPAGLTHTPRPGICDAAEGTAGTARPNGGNPLSEAGKCFPSRSLANKFFLPGSLSRGLGRAPAHKQDLRSPNGARVSTCKKTIKNMRPRAPLPLLHPHSKQQHTRCPTESCSHHSPELLPGHSRGPEPPPATCRAWPCQSRHAGPFWPLGDAQEAGEEAERAGGAGCRLLQALKAAPGAKHIYPFNIPSDSSGLPFQRTLQITIYVTAKQLQQAI